MTIAAQTFSRIDGLRPLAPAVGPFPLPGFVTAVTELRGEPVEVIGSEAGALPVTLHDQIVRVAGHADLTDYHSPLGADVAAIASDLAEMVGEGRTLDLDSMPEEACEPLAAALRDCGIEVAVEDHTVAAVVVLPDTFDEYLASLSKKQRHEVRRKRRRYEEAVGAVAHESYDGVGWALDEFFKMHRLSSGDKGDFLTPARRHFFETLMALPGWRVDVLRVPDTDRAAAALVSYADEDGIYLYNSSYDPEFSEASPGVAIVGTLIERAIEEGIPRFDFLKGDEIYKFRLGAEARQLYRITTEGNS